MNDKKKKMSFDSVGKILDKIEDSFDEMDFDGLSKNIQESVDFIRREAQEGYKNFRVSPSEEQKKFGKKYASPYDRYKASQEQMAKEAADQVQDAGEQEADLAQTAGGYNAVRKEDRKQHAVKKEKFVPKKNRFQDKLIYRSIPGRSAGPVEKGLGICALIIFGGLTLAVGIAGLVSGAFSGILGLSLPMTVLGGALYAHGHMQDLRARRLISYNKLLKKKDFVMLDELSQLSGETEEQLVKDMDFVIKQKLIPGMTMDEKKTCLLFNDEAREQYEQAEESRLRRELEELRKKTEEEELERKKTQGSKEEKEWIAFHEAMQDFFQALQLHKEQIDHPVMRQKMEDVELILSQISVCVKEHPDMISGTGHLISYYLPCMDKLLKTYNDLEEQPIQGENIQKTQKEIENSFTTIQAALTNMYDEMFRNVSMDISSDIQVLKAILAQDGLQEDIKLSL